ncbi:MAG: PAS domain-containing protein, partial [Candidatus Competibacteraceae bacterium]|nr:PAS domain-containing protein [Candidatus Competibacteraceae bacterium]
EYISEFVAELSGYPATDFIQNQRRTFASLIHPDDSEQVQAEILRAVAKRQSFALEYRILHQDGSIRWVHEKGAGVFTANGELLHLDGAIFDISAQKQAEEARRIAEENYRSIFENALQGIFQSTEDGRFLTVNSAMARIHGYESAQEMITSVTSIAQQVYVNPEDRRKFHHQLETHGQVKDWEYQAYRKDGSIIWVGINARAVNGSDGQLLYYQGLLEDVTERIQEEERLQRQIKELQVEIDHQKRKQDVGRITQSDFFQAIQSDISNLDVDDFWN